MTAEQEVRAALAAGEQLRDDRFIYWMNEDAVHGHCFNGCCDTDWDSFERWWKSHAGRKFEILPAGESLHEQA
jgi:hypothetical protein